MVIEREGEMKPAGIHRDSNAEWTYPGETVQSSPE